MLFLNLVRHAKVETASSIREQRKNCFILQKKQWKKKKERKKIKTA